MAQSIFVNFPVKDLEISKQFYSGLGFSINPQFTDETTACVVISDTIYVTLLTEARMKDFTDKQIADANTTCEVRNALSVEDKAEVNRFVDKAMELGATVAGAPQDEGFMFSRGFNDPDGHSWDIFWMDPSKIG